jgi:hypothetical protein
MGQVAGRRSQVAGAVFVAVALVGCGSSGSPSDTGGSEVGTTPLAVASPDFQDKGTIPKQFTCDGAGTRPTISWAGIPRQAKEVALLVGDPDAPGGTFVHWTVWNLPLTSKGSVSSGALPPGAVQGQNSGGSLGWTPPCPPKGGKAHQYIFGVYALRARVNLQPGESPSKVVPAVRAVAIATGSLTASYGR